MITVEREMNVKIMLDLISFIKKEIDWDAINDDTKKDQARALISKALPTLMNTKEIQSVRIYEFVGE